MVKFIKTPQTPLSKLVPVNSQNVVLTTITTLAVSLFAVLTYAILSFDYKLPRFY